MRSVRQIFSTRSKALSFHFKVQKRIYYFFFLMEFTRTELRLFRFELILLLIPFKTKITQETKHFKTHFCSSNLDD